MKQLIIKNQDIYKVGVNEYFRFKYNDAYLLNFHTDLSKNPKHVIEIIASVCELDYKGLKKKQLVDLIEKSNCVILENENIE